MSPDWIEVVQRERREILDYVRELHRANDLPQWVVNHEGAILAGALKRRVDWGPRGRIIHQVLRAAGSGLLSLGIVRCLGIAMIFRWSWRAIGTRPRACDAIFVGFGAGAERDLFSRMRACTAGEVLIVSERDSRTLANAARPAIADALRMLARETRLAHRAIRESSRADIRDNRAIWLTILAMRAGEYAYLRAWLNALPERVSKLVFVASDVACMAAVDARPNRPARKVEYWQHGFRYAALLVPHVDTILALNAVEGEAMRVFTGAEIHMLDRPSALIGFTRTILVASIYDVKGIGPAERRSVVDQLIRWAKTMNVKVVVRPHPREDLALWRAADDAIEVDLSGGSFQSCIDAWRPFAVVSWFSTAMLDALRAGVLPVMFSEQSGPFIGRLLLPLEEFSLSWPSCVRHLETLASDGVAYRKEVRLLQEKLFGKYINEQVIEGS